MRFINLGTLSPEKSICSEQAVLESHNNGCEDTLMIYSRDRPTISLGRFSDRSSSIKEDVVADKGITVIRRMSGGSAIYCDRSQMTFSVVLKRGRFASNEESYQKICGCIVSSLMYMGVDAVYKPVNDILVNGKKISGSSQYRDKNSLLHHGSLIISTEQQTIDEVLIPLKRRSYNGITSVKDAIGHIPSESDIADSFMIGFSTFGTMNKGSLSDQEVLRIGELMSERCAPMQRSMSARALPAVKNKPADEHRDPGPCDD